MNIDAAYRRPTGWWLWVMAARPKTLTIAVAPVLAGSALAVALGQAFRPGPMVAALAGAILIQAGTNLHNDVADALGGGDRPLRPGPPRITALGWAPPGRVRAAAFLCFGLAAVVGLYLAVVGGWPIVALGLLSLLAGWAYSGGPMPISHTMLGEVFVLAFFGIGAVAGSAWLQGLPADWNALVLGLAIGFPAAAVLTVNNYRDAEADRLAGRHTLAMRIGPAASRHVYGALMLLPFALLPLLPPGASAGVLALPLAVLCIRDFRRLPPGPAFNRILAATARTQLALAASTSLGMLVRA
ncbi:MAG: 1,4-dihydroxy-2-naphthoate octaprenyltransferase [Magnetospirillum sp.]|nr:1,4-dihydroxy-2-naphthoate octaprenyltransferase [Magnetospirillum sp.]